MILWWIRICNEFEVNGNRYDIENSIVTSYILILTKSAAWNVFSSTSRSSKRRNPPAMVSPLLTGPPVEAFV